MKKRDRRSSSAGPIALIARSTAEDRRLGGALVAVFNLQGDTKLHRRNASAIEPFGVDLGEEGRAFRDADQVGVEAIGSGDAFRMRDDRVKDRRRCMTRRDRGGEARAPSATASSAIAKRRQSAAVCRQRNAVRIDAHPCRQRRQDALLHRVRGTVMPARDPLPLDAVRQHPGMFLEQLL